MRNTRLLALLAATLTFAAPAAAQVTVTEPWIRATVVQQMGTGAFMTLTSVRNAKLVEVRSPVAGIVEIHEMKLENNVMRMRAVPVIDLPAGQAVELKPGGYHVMLMDLKRQLKEGGAVPLTLVIETAGKRETLEVSVPVRSPTARSDTMGKRGH